MKLNRNTRRWIARTLLLVFLLQVINPGTIVALTSGPSQPEVQSFKQAGNDNMVDLFSGDFNYSIPLFELPGPNGGYPFVLNYNAGITPDQEASWVGLGWNLSVGAITRQMRGIPDDFAGGEDNVVTELRLKPSTTIGVSGGVSGELLGADFASGNLGLTIFKNTYNGIGYSIDAGAGITLLNKDNTNASLGLNFSLGNEGVSIKPSISLDSYLNRQRFSSSLGLGFNSIQGLHAANFNMDFNSTGFDFSTATFSPSISMPMLNTNISADVKGGVSIFGYYVNGYLSAFFNEQVLRDNFISRKAFGFLNEQLAGRDDLFDFHREKQGLISEETPNLPIPVHTFDVFAVNAHGFGGTFRPYRNDIGVLADPYVESTSSSTSIGGDIGPGLAHFGGNASVLIGKNYSQVWNEFNNVVNKYGFTQSRNNETYENWYFASINDNSYLSKNTFDQFDQEKPITANLIGLNAISGFQKINTPKLSEERVPRNQVLIPITFEDLFSPDNKAILPYFEIEPGMENYPKNHIAGFMGITSDGARYIFGLPVYNHEQYELSFSAKEIPRVDLDDYFKERQGNDFYKVSGTDEFYQKKSISKYAYAYLLTAVLGTDYIDVEDDGVTQDDLGYWVKFTYGEHGKVNDYYWRNPFRGIVYNEAYYSTEEDDRGSLIYGRKDIRYLTSVETKTHVALFDLQDRKDGKGFVTDPEKAHLATTNFKSQMRLNHIELYTRQGLAKQIPIRKIVFFETDDNEEDIENYYILSGNVPNNENYNANAVEGNAPDNSGKLTLKSIKFIDGERDAALIKPYEFTYSNNPEYTRFKKDSWGYYYPHESEEKQEYLPYIDQKIGYDENYNPAAAWSLSSITLPSGSTINVIYEPDDYAYVQHKKAMQFVPISDENVGTAENNNFFVEFPFESQEHILEDYISGIEDFYIKAKFKLVDDKYDFVTGYFQMISAETIVKSEKKYGKIFLKPIAGKDSDGASKNYHPIRVMAWQHMRLNQPKLMRADSGDNDFNLKSIANFIEKTLGQIKGMFKNFYGYAFKAPQEWAKSISIDLEGNKECWIRLNNPEGKKFGGGLRVKQISYNDGMGSNYGQVYEYTTTNETGKTISSGVAAFEPSIGGEENPLRTPKMYQENVGVTNSNNLFFEYPINESYYPGASVGYSKVTVKSLAAQTKSATQHHGSTGMVVHEFYTARDFPVITAETLPQRKKDEYSLLIPFLGSVSNSQLAVSQGYSVITNDMHGKPKQVSNFSQKDDGTFAESPFSWVRYKYKSKSKIYQGEYVNQLDNEFAQEGDHLITLPQDNPSADKVLMGTQQEIFTDMMKNVSNPVEGGLKANVIVIPLIFFVITIPTVYPRISNDYSDLHMSVTNKVIHQNGYLIETEAYTEGSKVVTQNVKWDKITGAPILARVSNAYKDTQYDYTYNYNQLAYHQYPEIGPAYTTAGARFQYQYIGEVRDETNNELIENHHLVHVVNSDQLLNPGDELILSLLDDGSNAVVKKGKATYLGERNGWQEIYAELEFSTVKKRFLFEKMTGEGLIFRPGQRNMLGVQVGSVTALTDPTEPTSKVNAQFEFLVPNE